MPDMKVDPNSGAVLIKLSPEERQRKQMVQDIKIINKKLDSIESQIREYNSNTLELIKEVKELKLLIQRKEEI